MNESILAPVAALTLPDSAALTGRAQRALAFIDSIEIVSDETYGLAADELRVIKTRIAALEDQRTGITGPINAALKAINNLFRGPAEVLGQAESMLKRKMLGWQAEQERIAAEARRVAEEAAAAQRRALEAEAAQAQREAQAQQQAAAQAAQAQRDAEAATAAAVVAGDAEAARKAQADAEAAAQAQALAQAATQRAQAQAAQAATAAQIVTAPVVHIAPPPKAAGISTSSKLDFEVTNLLALVQHIAAHPELIALLRTDEVRLRGYVKGLGAACSLPGVRVVSMQTMSARAA